ncbi:protein yippee-like 2 isoform X3 [Ovis aries]|uniref:protein yippee-like 2 isoform X3 n=1 Tax=Ovis aries TaxID=9940 RepID=UPI0029528182|nr:protein yippee-like 2 isoform X3 [Ovis aries]XP_060251135.1 protein yippee-like 2 isoform X3 [Ovis aries]
MCCAEGIGAGARPSPGSPRPGPEGCGAAAAAAVALRARPGPGIRPGGPSLLRIPAEPTAARAGRGCWLPVFPSIRVFSNESALRIRWPKDWSFSFSISSPNEFDLLAVQGTLKSLLQYHTLKAVLQRSAFFMVQLSASIRDSWKNHT